MTIFAPHSLANSKPYAKNIISPEILNKNIEWRKNSEVKRRCKKLKIREEERREMKRRGEGNVS